MNLTKNYLYGMHALHKYVKKKNGYTNIITRIIL